MKRSSYLVPLSREHHEGLVIVSRLRNGLKGAATTEAIHRYVCAVWEKHLSGHFRREEELLPPALIKGGLSDLVERLLEEHRQLKALFSTPGSAPNLPDRYEELSRLLQEHIRFEERELFPEFERVADESTLMYVGGELEREATAMDHDPVVPEWETEERMPTSGTSRGEG